MELLRRGTDEARDSAIECIRTALAPCALDAYPVCLLLLNFMTIFFLVKFGHESIKQRRWILDFNF